MTRSTAKSKYGCGSGRGDTCTYHIPRLPRSNINKQEHGLHANSLADLALATSARWAEHHHTHTETIRSRPLVVFKQYPQFRANYFAYNSSVITTEIHNTRASVWHSSGRVPTVRPSTTVCGTYVNTGEFC
ncbi:hypothetical protein J6590_053532 [Homalodisca vitripennis]|nr:hypothetical protein J6590_053532 [Homalodisca vitripennis]